MKKNYFLMLTLLFVSLVSFGQTTIFQESFETGNTGTASQDCTDNFNDFFTRTDGSNINSNYEVSGQDGDWFFAAMDIDGAPCDMNPSTLEFNNIDISGATNLNFAILLAEDDDGTNQDWDDADNFKIEYDIDNSGTFSTLLEVKTTESGSNNEPFLDGVAITNVFTEFIKAIPATGSEIDIKMTFLLNSGDEDIAIDNIRLVDGEISSPPSIAITGVTDNQVFSPATSEVAVSFSIANFTLSGDSGSGASDNSGDGYVKTTLVVEQTNTVQNFFTDSPTPIEVIVGSTYTATAELVDNAGNSLDPKVESSVTFSIASYTEVISISDLRNGTEGNYYRLDGDNVTLTYARDSRNQKYIQDQTGGILIDDSAGVISTEYSTYAVMPILTGRLGSFGGVLQLIPDQDPGASQFNNDGFQPVQVSLADYVANFENYESELITINDISFDSGDVGNNFASSTNYDITSGQTSSIFRTNFSEADYIGTAIPSGTVNITAFGAEFNGTPQIIAINLAGIVLGVQQNQIEGFTTFPNPVTNGELTITSGSATSKVVSIYNVLGKQVLTDVFSGTFKTVNLANFSSGIYILKVAEGDKIATKKLVIK
jgi:hypothetical protein